MATTSAPTLLTVDDVCEICQVSKRTVRRWIAEGSLPAQRLGGHMIRVRPEDIEALLHPIPNARTGQDWD